jgi:DNA-binding response OmpR family regulator
MDKQNSSRRGVIGVIAEGDVMPRKIKLILGDGYTVLRTGDEADKRTDALIRINYSDGAPISLTLSRDGRKETLPYPFTFGELRSRLLDIMSGEGAPRHRLLIESDSRHIVLDGEKIRLTESEHKLISLIAKGDGELVSREELTRGVFGEGVDAGILNVYIHYLREKLEGKGERIILASRRGGYRIDKKYLGGEG